MHRISYAATDFLTDSRIAAAVMEYARVLAVIDSSDVINVPGVDHEGVVRQFQMLVGPASQILATETSDDAVPMPIEEAVQDLVARAENRLPRSDDVVRAGLPADDPLATELDDKSSPV